LKCAGCGKEYEDSFSYCPYCGVGKRGESGAAKKDRARPVPRVVPAAASGYSEDLAAGDKVTIDEKTPTEAPKMGWIPIAAIVIAVLAVVGWVLVGAFIGTGESSDEVETEAVAEDVIDNVTNEDFEAIFDDLDSSDQPLVGLLISGATEQDPGDILILKPDADLRDKDVTREFVEEYFASIKKYLQKGDVKSIDSRKLVEESNYVVAVHSFDSDVAFPLMEINTGDGWKVDLSSLLLISSGGTASAYIRDSVEALLAKPTTARCEKALKILDAAGGLEEKYDLCLMPETESLLSSEVVEGLTEGKEVTQRFERLRLKAEELEKMASSSDDDSIGEAELPQQKPPIVGEGDTVTAPFDLNQGLVIFHFDYQAEGWFSVGLLTESGREVDRTESLQGPLVASNALGVRKGTYVLEVKAQGPWTVGIEEPAPLAVRYPPLSCEAAGPVATPFFQTRGGPLMFTMDFKGDGDFVVTVMEAGGNSIALVANETGPFNGSRLVSLRRDVNYLLNVEADGPWAISID
jgi:hypothetical protein